MNFGDFVRAQHEAGRLVVQPRMGFHDPDRMRKGLAATRNAAATTVGTITLDSYTRVGDLESVDRALRAGIGLNGYPIVSYDEQVTRSVLQGIEGEDFPVQVRHGSARPLDIFKALAKVGLHATEGGPVSYCLPYGRTPLDESVRNWVRCCKLALRIRDSGVEPHLETFGGCMMGQLCPPSLLVAISALEGLFFYRQGVRSISVSYAQQVSMEQDQDAVDALRRLCAELLPQADWHVVVYAYMGLFPKSPAGSRDLLTNAVELAVTTGAERLIVKTVAESHRIPDIAENIEALDHAGAADRSLRPADRADSGGGQVYEEAYALVEAVLNCAADVGRALVVAFKRGLLDVPYCLHPDNAGRSRSYIDAEGKLRWAELGSLPLSHVVKSGRRNSITSANLMEALSFVQRTYDSGALEYPADRRGELC